MVEGMGSIDGSEISFEEFLLMTAIQIDTLSQILIEKASLQKRNFTPSFRKCKRDI